MTTSIQQPQTISLKLESHKKYAMDTIGSTVDLENATWTNFIGSPELIAVWEDPDFDATPDARKTITERAYTVPIW